VLENKEVISILEKWSNKYKKSIDCSNPKGFSQRAHCAGRRKRKRGDKTKSRPVESFIGDIKVIKLKEIIENKILSESMIDDFVRRKMSVQIGTGTYGFGPESKPKQFYVDKIESMIYNYFMDMDFALNWLDKEQRKEYKESIKRLVVNPFKSNPDSFIKKYLEITKDVMKGESVKMKDMDYDKLALSFIKKQSKPIQDAWKKYDYDKHRTSGMRNQNDPGMAKI
jgi:hypothetical protein